MIITCGDSSIDFEMTEDALDAVTLPIELLVVADRRLTVRFGRNDRFDVAGFEIGADRIGVVGFIGEERLGAAFRQIDQALIRLAVRGFARREVEGDGSSSSITQAMNFTGEPAPRAAKSSSMNPPFPPAAET